MTLPADASPEDKPDAKPELEAKPEARKRKSEPKKAGTNEPAPARAKAASETSSDAGKDAEAGTALAPAGTIPIDPFLAAKAEDKVEPPAPPRSLASRMLDYSAHMAIIVGLIGFAWTVSGHVIGQKKGDAPVTTARSSKSDEMSDLRLANVKLHEEIKSLKASVDSLRTSAKRDTTAEQVRVLSAGLENVKSTLGSSKSETTAAIAQLQSKIDKLSPGKMQALSERVGRLEHSSVDTAATGSIPRSEPSRSDTSHYEPSRADLAHSEPAKPAKSSVGDTAKVAPKPPAKPAELAKLDDSQGGAAGEDGKPPVLQGWVVRDVYQGVALIEGKRGTLEVVPGVSIPGAGVVKSIERKGGGWVVTTSKGQLAYAGTAAQREQRERRDYRRGGYDDGYSYNNGGYRPYRYGY